MVLSFKFVNENGPAHCVQLPPNLLLAYNDLKRAKRDYIIFGVAGIIFFGLLSLFVPLSAKILFMIGLVICSALLGVGIANRKPRSLRLYACIMTEEFDEYIASVISRLEQMLSPQVANAILLDRKEAKRINKILITAQRLKEVSEECNRADEGDDLGEYVDFIEGCCENMYGFMIREENVYAKPRKIPRDSNAIKLLKRNRGRFPKEKK